MKKIDLNNLNEDQLELLQRTSKKLIVDYKNLIKNIYSDSDKSIDWKLNSLLSRDNYLSNVFKDICYVFFIKKSLSIDNIDLIICNNYPQKTVLQKYIDSNSLKVKVITHETLLQRIKVYFTPYLLFYLNIKLIFSFLYNSRRKRFDLIKNKKKITLIDIFFIDAMFKNNEYNDRYYSNLLNSIPSNQKKNYFFLPTILVSKKLKEKIKLAEQSNNQFMFIFDVLKIRDYFFALLSPFRINKINLKKYTIGNINVGPILIADFRKNISNKSSFLGILNYLFFKSINKEKIELRLVIDWFENQIIDRGFNLGKNKFYPDIPSIGYQGFTDYHDFHSHFIPTKHEIETNQSPDKLALISKKIAKQVKEFYPYVNIILCPAFRFKYLHDKKLLLEKNIAKEYRVLLILPSSNIESSKLINMVLDNIDFPDFNNIKWLIKPHPNRNINIINNDLSLWSDKLEIINTSFNIAIDNADLMIGNTSSTCIEALARGKPVIISCNNNFVDQNPIPNDYPKEFWAICNNSTEFKLSIKSFLLNRSNKSQDEIIGFSKKVLGDFFEPISDKAIKNFFQI